MECDERSCKACVALVKKGKKGYAEAYRVLAHLINDKNLDLEKPRINSSQWLKRASEEAMDAIEHPEILGAWTFNGSRAFYMSLNHWSAWQPSPRPSSSWGPHAPAESMEYGKGTSYGKDKGTITMGSL